MTIATNIIISKSALNGVDFKESIDLGLVCAAFDHRVSLIFTADGIFNLIPDQSYSNLRDKNQLDILKGLEFYDIENIYVEQESLANSTLEKSDLLPFVEVKTCYELLKINLAADHLVEF